jgi:hypothetical protein
MTMNPCDQSSVKVTPSSSNGQNTMISEGEYNTEIKRKYHTVHLVLPRMLVEGNLLNSRSLSPSSSSL